MREVRFPQRDTGLIFRFFPFSDCEFLFPVVLQAVRQTRDHANRHNTGIASLKTRLLAAGRVLQEVDDKGCLHMCPWAFIRSHTFVNVLVFVKFEILYDPFDALIHTYLHTHQVIVNSIASRNRLHVLDSPQPTGMSMY